MAYSDVMLSVFFFNSAHRMDDMVFPLADVQTMLSAVLVLGPRSAAFHKPVIVSFQHCASVRHGQWSLTLYGSDSPVHRPPNWQVGI